jgi:hypothetical protein
VEEERIDHVGELTGRAMKVGSGLRELSFAVWGVFGQRDSHLRGYVGRGQGLTKLKPIFSCSSLALSLS